MKIFLITILIISLFFIGCGSKTTVNTKCIDESNGLEIDCPAGYSPGDYVVKLPEVE
jgi:thioredoxin-related protein